MHVCPVLRLVYGNVWYAYVYSGLSLMCSYSKTLVETTTAKEAHQKRKKMCRILTNSVSSIHFIPIIDLITNENCSFCLSVAN